MSNPRKGKGMKYLPIFATAAAAAIALICCADNGVGTRQSTASPGSANRLGTPLTAPYVGSTAGVVEQDTGGANSGAPNDPRALRNPNQPAGANEGGTGGTGSGGSGSSGNGG